MPKRGSYYLFQERVPQSFATIPIMRKRRLVLLLACAAATTLFAARLLQAQEKLVLLETQKLIMENQFVRVIDVRVPAGVAERVHSHGRGVTVALTDYDNETRAPGGQWSKSHTKFGEVKWAEPVTHEARNTGTTEQHVIRVELK
jgi:hypothetical protein